MKNALLLLVFTLAASFLTTSAQETQEVKKTKPFALDTLVQATQISEEALSEAKRLVNDTASYFGALAAFEKLLLSNAFALENDSVYADYSDLPLSAFEETGRFWLTYKTNLDDIHQNVSFKIGEMSSLVQRLSVLNDRWLATRDQDGAERQDSGAIFETVDSYSNSIASINARLKVLLNRYVAIDARLINHNKQVEVAMQRLDEVVAAKAKSMFVKDAKPLFSTLAEDSLSTKIVVQRGWQFEKKELAVFLKNNQMHAIWHLLFTLLSMGLMLALSRYARPTEGNAQEDIGEAITIIKHPLLIGLLIGLFSTNMFYMGLPVLYLNGLISIGLIPVSVLLPQILKKRMPLLPAFLALLVLASVFMGLLRNHIAYERLALFIAANLMLACLLLLLFHKKSRKAIVAEGGFSIVVIVVFFVVLLAASSIFNLIGLAQLGVLIAIGVVYSFFVGLIAFVTVKMTTALFGSFLNSAFAQKLNLIRNNAKGLLVWLKYLASILGIVFWVRSVMASFKILSTMKALYTDVVAYSYEFGEVSLSLQNIIDFVVILFVFYVIAKLTHLIIQDEVLPRYDLRAGLPLAMAILSRYIILFLGFVLAMSAAGISLSKLNLILGALGVGIGFGLQGIVSNFVSGFVIIFERPIHLGDSVRTGAVEGDVSSIGLRSTRIRTYDGSEVIVPNNSIVSTELTNLTYSDAHRRIERFVYIEGGNNPRHVKQLIDGVLKGYQGLIKSEESGAYFLGYENNALKFRVLMWMKTDFLKNPSELLMNIHEALSANGYKPYIPVQKVYLQKEEMEAGEIIGEISEDANANEDANS